MPCDTVPELSQSFSGHMLARRYTVIIADRSSGVLRRATISVRGVLGVLSAIVGVPILMGVGAEWSAGSEIAELRGANTALQGENGSDRAPAGALTTQSPCLGDVLK